MPWTNRPFDYFGTSPTQILDDLTKANDNFEILGQAFVGNDPTTQKAKDADRVDGYHASQTPSANTIPVARSDGKLDAGWLPSVGGTRMIIFTSSGTWTVPSGVSNIYVMLIGGGGGGGGASVEVNAIASAGGGFGGQIVFSQISVTSGSSLTITIGAGGAGGTAFVNSANSGGTGGTTSIALGNTVLASASGGAGGGGARAGSSGSIVIGTGRRGSRDAGGNGEPRFGSGGSGGHHSAGGNGSGYGCGGGGAHSFLGYFDGGAGTAGLVVIWY